MNTAADTMTMRDYFAAQALQGILSNPTWNPAGLALRGISEGQAFVTAASLAFRYADAMIARAKETT